MARRVRKAREPLEDVELKLLHLVAQGHTNKEIAARIGRSPTAVGRGTRRYGYGWGNRQQVVVSGQVFYDDGSASDYGVLQYGVENLWSRAVLNAVLINDEPGIEENSPGKRIVGFHLHFIFITSVWVTAGNQFAQCPDFLWTVSMTLKDGKFSSTVLPGSTQ
jgi:hypothetical protein